MTQAQLQRKVAYWQKALEPLGIGHWKITVDIEDEPRGIRNSDAAVFIPNHYDTANMEFRRSHVEEATLEEMDCTIVHELVHLAFRDLRSTCEIASRALSPSAEVLFDEQFDHEMEGINDRMARALVTAHNAAR